MGKWFDQTPDRYKKKILDCLDKLSVHVKDRNLKIEMMMSKTKYLYEFCEECVDIWEEGSRKKTKVENKEEERSLF